MTKAMFTKLFWADYGDYRLIVESQHMGWIARVYDIKKHIYLYELSVDNPAAGKAISWQWIKQLLGLRYDTQEPTWDVKEE